MAEINFNNLSQETSGDNSSIGFFNLKSNGEEAIVRFMYDNNAEFKILSTHDVVLNGKHRKANCIRSANEPLDACPLCARGESIQNRFFITLIQYTKEANGTITAQPKVWERPVTYASTLNSYLENYGPLSDIICKVIRHGNPGDLQTKYEIIPNLNKQIYTDEAFPKLTGVFDNYSPLGRIVLDKNFNELQYFANTGTFPQVETNTVNTPQAAASAVSPAPAPVYTQPEGVPWSSAPTPPFSQNNTQWSTAAPTVERPVRSM